MQKKSNPAALLPIFVFLVLYLGLGLVFEYVLKIPMGFYSIPIVVIFLIALLVACCQNHTLSFDEKLVLTLRANVTPAEIPPYNLIQIIPYVLVLIGGIIGINVFVVLLIGIVSGSVIALATGATGQSGILAVKALLENMGSGAAGMFETSMVAILVSAICALIREFGGFEALLGWIRRAFRGKRGGQIGMGLLVGAMDIATANNTVAIVMANPIAKEMSEEYGITPRKAASLLDTFSCIFQGIIPYGAQMLVAISAAHELGYNISAFDIIPNLFYPYLLAVSSLFFIAVDGKKKVS